MQPALIYLPLRRIETVNQTPNASFLLFPCVVLLVSRLPNLSVSACDPAEVLAIERNYSNIEQKSAPVGVPVQNPAEVGSLLLRRSLDSGRTWLPMQQIYFRPGLNIDFLSGVNDLHSGTTWLFLQVC